MKKFTVLLTIIIMIMSLHQPVSAQDKTELVRTDNNLEEMLEPIDYTNISGSTSDVSIADKSSNLIITLKRNSNVIDFINNNNLEVLAELGNEKIIIEVDELNYELIKSSLSQDVINIEENQKGKISANPNDTYYNYQWALPAMRYHNVWTKLQNTPLIYTCILDSGIMYHPDLANIDVRKGFNYYAEYGEGIDDNGHGTAVTGVITADTNNMKGISGVVKTTIIPMKVTNSNGNYLTSDLVKAIIDSADVGCGVINMSLSSTGSSYSEHEAIKYAISKGVIVVSSAGNDGNSSYNWPASYPEVISVGSVREGLGISRFSNYNNQVTVVAPGESILLPDMYSQDYAFWDGTSFSAPYVSAIAIALKSLDSSMNQSKFMNLLKSTSRNLGAVGYDNYYGHGLVNYEALLNSTKTIKEIKLNVYPRNIHYAQHDIFDPTGGKVRVYYTDNTSKDVNLTASMVSGIDMSTSNYGPQTATIVYGGKVTNFTIFVTKFRDVRWNSTYYSTVMDVVNKGFANGYQDGTFGVNDNITRAQAAVMLVNALGLDKSNKITPFKDVPTTHFAAGHIAAAVKAGILKGYNPTTFGASDYVTRAQLAVMVANAFNVPLNSNGIKVFRDVPTNFWAYSHIQKLVSQGIVNGTSDTTFNPDGLATRGQFSVFLSKAYKLK